MRSCVCVSEQDDSFESVGEGLQAPGSVRESLDLIPITFPLAQLFQTPMETEVARAAEPESAGSHISAPWKSWFQNRRAIALLPAVRRDPARTRSIMKSLDFCRWLTFPRRKS